MSTKLVNGIEVPLSAEDIAERAADAAAYTAQAATSAAQVTRAATRAAMRAQWDGLPDWINGYHLYRFAFDSVNNLLDEDKKSLAVTLISGIEPNAAILADATVYPELGNQTKAQFFAYIKGQFSSAISSL